jgi:hypothetical protein
VKIDGWRTPAREVSCYRAALGDVIVCSNSLDAIRRVIDAHAGKLRSLADSLDFQYMRTVFERNASKEDGFVFLSDAFIRRLVGPATRIKAMRRGQARSALALASHAAVFAGHEAGTLPADTRALCAQSGLPEAALVVPDGKPVSWDGSRRQAVSEVYGTLQHGTPLLDLPIDRVTGEEKRAYDDFQRNYLRLWTDFFDPVALRFKVGPGPARVDVYILPLIRSPGYRELRALTQGGLLRYDPRQIPPGTVLQLLLRLPVERFDKEKGLRELRMLGDWGLLHIDGDKFDLALPVQRAIESELRQRPFRLPGGRQVRPRPAIEGELTQAIERGPLSVGVAVRDAAALSKRLLEDWKNNFKPKGKELTERTYRGVTIKEVPLDPDRLGFFLPRVKVVFQATVDKGYYLSASEGALKRRIDTVLSLRKAKPGKTEAVHAALYLAPPRGKVGEALAAFLDWRCHMQAQAGLALWEGLYAGHVVSPSASASARDDAVRRLLGYVPVSPDGTTSARAKDRQIQNAHHGTLARPTFQAKLPASSNLTKLLSQLRGVRIDLRFREDGVHSSLTIDWAAARK